MAHTTSLVLAGFIAITAFLSQLPTVTADFTIEYCSSQNTAADSEPAFWTWQSNGWCTDKCRSTSAFAVIKDKDCWCSDYIPAEQDDISDCDKHCPGYKTENCGSSSGNRFVYIAIEGKKPSGTQGGSQPTSAKVSSSSAPSPTPSVEPPPKPSSRPSSSQATTDDDSSSAAPTTLQTSMSSDPVTSNRVITISNGQIVTETIIITPKYSPTASSAPALTETDSSGPNIGAIVGGVVGGILGLLAIIGGVLFFLWRRRKRARELEDQDHDRQSGIARNTSTMSKAGLLRTEKAPQYPPQITTSFGSNKRSSRMMQDNESISPISGSDRRSSRPYIFDQRLNPSAIMTFENTSRGSFASMDDSRDYGRTLNVRNPDPEHRE